LQSYFISNKATNGLDVIHQSIGRNFSIKHVQTKYVNTNLVHSIIQYFTCLQSLSPVIWSKPFHAVILFHILDQNCSNKMCVTYSSILLLQKFSGSYIKRNWCWSHLKNEHGHLVGINKGRGLKIMASRKCPIAIKQVNKF